MAGLARPYAGSHPITQGFLGTYYNPATGLGEPRGYVHPDRVLGQRGYRYGWLAMPHVHLAQDVSMAIGTDLLAPCRSRLVAAGTYTITGEHWASLLFHRDATWQALVFVTHLKAGGLVVPVGTSLAAGQHFAESGSSGLSTGPHLHWEVRRGPATADPHLSGSWQKLDPAQCLVGGSLASAAWLVANV